ncbi:hypothetical protein Zmor_026496 [Zophobas morio]|uniref:Uncharacterized protein n=1 Tax=Zophobas morio TaxID=2755281 RepID=A0AA38M5C5_9CUCU|nr:hypothetical protein Zmor_026496 [Zophobas morio]
MEQRRATNTSQGYRPFQSQRRTRRSFAKKKCYSIPLVTITISRDGLDDSNWAQNPRSTIYRQICSFGSRSYGPNCKLPTRTQKYQASLVPRQAAMAVLVECHNV